MIKPSVELPESFTSDEVVFPELEPTRSQVCTHLKCSTVTLWRDITLLKKACPSEFEYLNNQETFDKRQFAALLKVRRMCLNYKNRKKVLKELLEKGI